MTARILKDSPYRVVLHASGGWSHGFLVEKNHCLWPDVKADRLRCQELQEGRASSWKDLTVAEIEDAGQQELMTWICVAGAMHEVGQKGEVIEYLETAGGSTRASVWLYGDRKALSKNHFTAWRSQAVFSFLENLTNPSSIGDGDKRQTSNTED